MKFFLSTFFFFFTHNTTQHPKYNKTKQQTHTQHLKVQSKVRERGKDNKNTKVTPLYNHVYPSKNTVKHQWSKAWPHRLTPLYIHMSLFAGGYGSNMFFYMCGVNQFWIIVELWDFLFFFILFYYFFYYFLFQDINIEFGEKQKQTWTVR